MISIRRLAYLKPFIPRPLQLSIRRALIRWKLPSSRHLWPIDPNAATPPENWKGWPEGKKFAVVLTHDVDTQKGNKNCRRLADIDERMGFRSSFNFVAEDYTIDPELLNDLSRRGFEIGQHGIHHKDIFRSRNHFREQASRINEYLKKWNAVGFRGPSMFHNLDWIRDLDIEYDSSTFDTDPFEPQPEGAGTIFPFRVPGNAHRKSYIELPYTLPQDFLLFVLMNHKNIDTWISKLDWIAEKGGMVLLITHPDYMNFGNDAPGLEEYPPQFYEDFLTHIKTRYKDLYWHALPKDVARFWAQNYAVEEKKDRKPLRACMVVYSFYETDNRVMRYAEALAKRGDSVDVIALKKEGMPDYEEIRGVNVYRIQTRRIDEKGRMSYLVKLVWFLLNSAAFLTRKHLHRPYDLIHVHSVPDFEVFSTFLTKLKGSKIILDIHDIVPEFYASKFHEGKDSLIFNALAWMERLSIRFSDHVIISNHLWEKTLVSRSVGRDKCTVIMNYPDESIFYTRPRERKDDKFIMIYPGTLSWHQGLDIAINAFAQIKDQISTAEFHIFGNGPERERLGNQIARLGLENRVFISEAKPIDQIADVMANADLGIIPKRNDPFGGEAFSTKILEFMSLGIPVIVSETKIDRYYFNDSVVTFFKPDDVNDLARCMLTLAKDKELRNRFIENALIFVEDFSWKTKKYQYLDLVDTLVKEKMP